MNSLVLHKGNFDFKRIKDGVYLTFNRNDTSTMHGIVYTNDVRGRKWNAIDMNGKEKGKTFKTMTLAAESISIDA